MTVAPTGQYDVIIVGAGVAGALVGWKLAQAGRRVLILEAGEEGRSRAELVEEFAAASIKSLGSPYVASEPAKIPGPEQYSGTQKSRPVSVRDDYYDQNGKDKYLSTYERRVGGTTWHWLGHTPRLLPNDFNLSSLYGVDGLASVVRGYRALVLRGREGAWRRGRRYSMDQRPRRVSVATVPDATDLDQLLRRLHHSEG